MTQYIVTYTIRRSGDGFAIVTRNGDITIWEGSEKQLNQLLKGQQWDVGDSVIRAKSGDWAVL